MERKPRIIVVDDNAEIVRTFVDVFRDEFDVGGVTIPGNALAAIDDSVDVVVVDHRMPAISGLELLTQLRVERPDTVRILMTAYEQDWRLSDAVNLAGLFRYVAKPPQEDELRKVLREAVRERRKLDLARDCEVLANRQRALLKREGLGFSAFAADSQALRAVAERARKIVNTKHTVLLYGETGTGKDVLARAIHDEAATPVEFRAINCAAFSDQLLASEMFGSQRGAFTGAVDRMGIVEAADKGTLFLDEIGDMPTGMQALLLRFLETGEFSRVGESKVRRTNVRVISATHKNLEKEIEAGRFRRDLYFRIANLELRLPALRERRQDIPLLAQRFLQKGNERMGKSIVGFAHEALRVISGYDYPGNVRELIATVEHGLLFCDGTRIQAEDLPEKLLSKEDGSGTSSESGGSLKAKLAAFECEEISKVMSETVTQQAAARRLGISVRWLQERLERCRKVQL